MKQLTRVKRLEEWVCTLTPLQVIELEEIIEGKTYKRIERELGCMSTSQWRNCLLLSLNRIILNWN